VIALDASALLALLFSEPGHEQVEAVYAESCISAVNLSEVVGRFVRDGHDPQGVFANLVESGLEIVPFLGEDAALAAGLLAGTRAAGLSLGDRACIALAMARGIPALTADRAWSALDLPVSVRVIRG
jgi:PIN domain nuclease of toxin-antitoxin system